jgi:2-succinyl-6-hydroxy-2,4-cyclohexadiene-1-carboxylate synthase
MTKLALIHGFLGTVDDWETIQQRLSYPAEAVEVPAASDWAAGIKSMTSRLPASSVLVGYSMGARIALGCALNHALRLRALVLISGNPGLSDELRERRWTHDQQVCEQLCQLPIEQFLRQWYRQEVFSLTEAQIESLVEDKRDLNKHHFVRLMDCYSVAKQPNYWDRLGELTMPVLLVAGQRDPKYVSICREMQRLIPDGRFHLVEEAGHIVHRERPEQLATLLNGLVSDLLKENALR